MTYLAPRVQVTTRSEAERLCDVFRATRGATSLETQGKYAGEEKFFLAKIDEN